MNNYYKLDMKSLKDAKFEITFDSKDNKYLNADEIVKLLNEHHNCEIYVSGSIDCKILIEPKE